RINESVNDLMKPLANKFIEGKELERELNSLKNLIDKYYERCKRTFFDNNELLLVKNEIDDLINSI
ncbi:site-specific integrase, partial [Enterobacter hormaechei]|nr:site-specific integrase [Enterobacter hormaechei]